MSAWTPSATPFPSLSVCVARGPTFKTLLLLASIASAQQTPSAIIDRFGGLNDTDPSVTLQNFESQDLLNTESSLSGTSLLKRSGYSRIFSLALTTAAVNGSFSFIDPNGNRQDVVCCDHYCAKSTNGASFSVFLSTAGGSCVPTRWSFGQINGYLYGVNDCRDKPFQYDATTFLSPATMPQGSVLELTKDRLVIADVSSNPNGTYYSQSGTYTNFTTGLNSADPYVDPIGSPGDRVSALKYALGRLFVFKTSSIVTCILGDQYTSKCFPVSNSVGTQDPLSIVEVPGYLYFRGSDRNYWQLDPDGNLSLASKKISNFVASQNSGSTQSNTQSSQSDWQAGSQSPSGTWNTVTTAGSIFPSSITVVDTSGVDFASGTLSSLTTTYISGSVQMSSTPFLISNGNFATGTLSRWTARSSLAAGVTTDAGVTGGYGYTATTYDAGCSADSVSAGLILASYTFFLYDQNLNSLYSVSLATGVYDLVSLGVSTQPIRAGFRNNHPTNAGLASWSEIYSSTFTGFSLSFDYNTVKQSLNGADCIGSGGDHGTEQISISSVNVRNVKVSSYFAVDTASATPTSFQSRVFDTAFTSTTGGSFNASSSTPQGTALAYQVRSASSTNGIWSAWANVTNAARFADGKRFIQYQSTFTTNVATSSARLDDVTLIAATTGQFYTQCIQPGTNISAWGILSCSETKAGNGSLVYYATSAATCATLPSVDPTSWQTSVTNNATLSISTNAALYLGFRSLLGSATDQAQVDDCTIRWTNGVAAPPVWGTFDSVKNAIYWTTAISNNATNNRVLKYDLNLNQWYPFGISANAIRNILGTNYFGDSTGGYWNQYGVGSSDNGSSISAYWKSKDFGNPTDPFLDNNYTRISMVAKNQITGNLTMTYTTSNNASGTYTVSLATTSGVGYVHANQALPQNLSPYQFMNVKISNNSTTPFEISGLKIDYTSFPWKAQNP